MTHLLSVQSLPLLSDVVVTFTIIYLHNHVTVNVPIPLLQSKNHELRSVTAILCA